MIDLNTYITEKLQIDKTVEINKTVEKIYNVLSQDKYNLTFKLKENSNIEDFIYKIPEEKLKGKYYSEKIKECFKLTNTDGYDVYKMAVWENGTLYFSENSRYSQGRIVYHENNTDFIYFILVKGNECTLCGYNRRYMGQPDEIGKQYKFKI